MNRRDFIGLSGAAVASGIDAPPERPNILMIMADQLRGDCLDAAGGRVVQTPHLDSLASEGVRFRCAYSSTPTCTPARAALLTGLSPWRHGMLGYGKIAAAYPVELPRVMREAGYYTEVIGKCHYHPQRGLHGFEHALLDESSRVENSEFRSDYRSWFWSIAPNSDPDKTGLGWNDYRAAPYALPEELHPTYWIGETAVRFLKSYQRSAPFFLKVSFERPHSPYDPPARLWNQYRDADIPKAQVGDWAAKYAPRSGPGNDIWHGDMGEAQVRLSRRGYYGNVTFVDEQVGRILETLRQRGMLEKTFILFLSDHGDMTGDHHLWRKSYAYEPSARIAMLFRWPAGLLQAARGQVLHHPVEIRDVLPTFLEVAQARGVAAHDFDGQSLLDPVRGSGHWREYIDLEHDVCYSRENHWNALTDGKAKYIYHAFDGREQLFDLAGDPYELRDLSLSASQMIRLWRRRLVEHLSIRGERFVRNNRLVPRPDSYLYSPHYPGAC